MFITTKQASIISAIYTRYSGLWEVGYTDVIACSDFVVLCNIAWNYFVRLLLNCLYNTVIPVAYSLCKNIGEGYIKCR